jgi:hypothetical protein
MIKNSFSILFFISALLLALILDGCSGSKSIQSFFTKNAITIDGNINDWEGSLHSIEGENVAVSVKNDDKDVYIVMVTSDRRKIMNILTRGLTIWLDPEGSDDKIGIKFPLRLEPGTFRDMRTQDPEQRTVFDEEKIFNNLIANQKELIIVNAGDIATHAFDLPASKLIEAKLGYSMNQLVYELRIPFTEKNSSAFGLKAKPGMELLAGFITGKFEIGEFRSGMQDRPGEGMRQPRGERLAGMPGGRGERGAGFDMQPMEYWFTVKLAE